MSTRLLPLLGFVVWGVICQQWYVCKIKGRCGQPVEMAAISDQPVAEITPAEPETTPYNMESAAEPAPEKPVESAKTQPSAADLEKVATSDEETVVELADDKVIIFFPYNKLEREPNAAVDEYLDRLADNLKSSGRKVTIVGHTDAIGDSKTNITFSERRAKNIRDILKKKGVSASQIVTVGHGESQPIGSNDNPQGRRQNRRVVFSIK